MPRTRNTELNKNKFNIGLLQFVGTALPGTNKETRSRDIVASSTLTANTALSEFVSSAGGFTVLGQNAFGQDVARDNITGAVKTVDAFNPISPAAKALGKSPTAKEAVKKSEPRRKKSSTGGGKKLGTSSILGSQSILG